MLLELVPIDVASCHFLISANQLPTTSASGPRGEEGGRRNPDLGWGAEDQSTMQPVDMTVKLAAGVVERLGAAGCRISLLSLLGEIMRLINFDCSGRVW